MKKAIKILAAVAYLMSTSIIPALSQEMYKFELMWPPLSQLWLFDQPHGVTTDASGNVYVADRQNNRIQKLDANGNLITKWGSQGNGDGQFSFPYGVATDASGNVYVADSWNHRIQKFDLNGNFTTKWGSYGSGDGEFWFPDGVAVDASGRVYVADTNNNRIQKFDANGNFITKWGSEGGGNGQFLYPWGVAADASGNVYVADTYNQRIQKFSLQTPTAVPTMVGWGMAIMSILIGVSAIYCIRKKGTV